MKLLKIYLAILLFSILGSVQNQLFAQPMATKFIYTHVPSYSGKQSLKIDEVFDSGNFIAGLRYKETDSRFLELHVVDKIANAIIKRIPLCQKEKDGDEIKQIFLDWDGSTDRFRLKCETTLGKISIIGGLSIAERNSFASKGHKVLDTTREVEGTAYLTLTSDGRFIITDQGMPNGVPIFQLGN